MIEACFMIASLDLPVQLNLHIHDQQSWQASQAVSIAVLGSSRILVVVERICGTLHPARSKSEKRSRWPSAQPAAPAAAARQPHCTKPSRR
jgi:hypothetical protein